jgi:uncharacterized membrane protein YdcZ (DUF606 family)
LQLRDEQGLLDVRIELVDQLAGAAVAAQRDSPEAFARQLPEALFCARYSFGVGDIELVSRITRAIHNNLDSHFLRSFSLTKGIAYQTI